MIGDVTTEDVEMEARMIELCRPGLSNTVVEVIKHGWLPRQGSIYFIDMEYCLETLESRIHGTGHKPPQNDLVSGKEAPHIEKRHAVVESISTRTTKVPTTEDMTESSPEFDWQSVIDVIQDINRGLMYLHQNRVVHRDVKPKNGTSLTSVLELTFCSIIFRP